MSIEPALRSLADAIEAGMSLGDPGLAAAMPPEVRAAMHRRGSALGDALKETKALDDGPAAIVVAGERGGFLPRALRLAADTVKAAQLRRRRTLIALAYPAFLVVAAGAILPLPLIVTKGVGAYVRTAAPAALGVVVVFVFAFVVLPRLPGAMRVLSRLPVGGTIVIEDARGACFEVLGALLSAGAPLTTSLPAAVRAAGLPWWSAGLARTEQVLARGGTLTEALTDGGFVDEARAGRVAIAERTGSLDKALPALAKEARDRAQGRFALLVIIAGFMCFATVAMGIGVAILSGAESYFETIDRATVE